MEESKWRVDEIGPGHWRVSLFKPGVPNRGVELSMESMTTEEMKELVKAIEEQV